MGVPEQHLGGHAFHTYRCFSSEPMLNTLHGNCFTYLKFTHLKSSRDKFAGFFRFPL